MTERAQTIEDEVRSIFRKADQLCSMHASLRDRYDRRARFLDYGLMAASIYLTALNIVDPSLGISLTFGLDIKLLNAAASLLLLFLAVVQFKSDWKSLATDHAVSAKEYAAVKSACRAITNGTRQATGPELQRIKAQYDAVTEVGTHIPEKDFLSLKAAHVRKVYISKHLDSHPGCSVALLRLKLIFRDTFGAGNTKDHEAIKPPDSSQSLPQG